MAYLTKSRFKIGHDCPTKLYYYNRPQEYANKSLDDPFLQALADGGFQVGELAKKYFPAKKEITTTSHRQAAEETAQLLREQVVTIHEAAFCVDDQLFIKADIVQKEGERLKLIEVKAKSFNSSEPDFKTKKGGVASDWKEYVFDLAFQYYVVTKCYPHLSVSAYLLLADKDRTATIEGLNQMFRISRDGQGKRPQVTCTPLPKEELGAELLSLCNLTDLVQEIVRSDNFDGTGRTFEAHVAYLADLCVNGKRVYQPVGKNCKVCPHVAVGDQAHLKDGHMECWKQAFPELTEEELRRPKFYDIWNIRKGAGQLTPHKYFMEAWEEGDIAEDWSCSPVEQLDEMDAKTRQWLQVSCAKEQRAERIVLYEGLAAALDQYIYPYHFIDFETMITALPFNKGLRPYEQVAFQFSHHVMNEDGSYYHASEWINTKQGAFPNFEFIRNLKKVLEHDNGTIFRYATHENTILNAIREQLQNSSEPDKQELIDFILLITTQKGKNGKTLWEGERNMQDLCALVKKYYYHPLMNGSNGIKKVLPAVLNDSEYLQAKYSQPIYGTQIPSKNYKGMVWIQKEGERVKDPYKLLESFYDEGTDSKLDEQGDEHVVNDGGAALVAYAEMQFSDVPEANRQKREAALKKYCELDTLAMVMIMEEFQHLVRQYRQAGVAAKHQGR